MSRRTQPCQTCEGRTRHADRYCSRCRRVPLRLRPFIKYLHLLHLTDWQQGLFTQTFVKGVDPIAVMRLQQRAALAISLPRQAYAFIKETAT